MHLAAKSLLINAGTSIIPLLPFIARQVCPVSKSLLDKYRPLTFSCLFCGIGIYTCIYTWPAVESLFIVTVFFVCFLTIIFHFPALPLDKPCPAHGCLLFSPHNTCLHRLPTLSAFPLLVDFHRFFLQTHALALSAMGKKRYIKSTFFVFLEPAGVNSNPGPRTLVVSNSSRG